MTWLNVKNNAESTLASGITAAATSLSVASGEGSKFPGSNFYITIDSEVLLCTTRTGDMLTVTRAQSGTTAAIHAIAAVVSLNIMKEHITELQANQDNHVAAVSGVHSLNKSCRVTHSAAQTVPNGAVTILSFDTERWDTDSIHDNATNNSRLTCKTAGLYLITLLCSFSANANGRRSLYLKKNGATWIGIVGLPAVPDGITSTLIEVSTQYQLAVNDYVEGYCYQNSGVDLTVSINAEYCPEFMMSRIA